MSSNTVFLDVLREKEPERLATGRGRASPLAALSSAFGSPSSWSASQRLKIGVLLTLTLGRASWKGYCAALASAYNPGPEASTYWGYEKRSHTAFKVLSPLTDAFTFAKIEAQNGRAALFRLYG